jgi:hypothetical protein
MRAAVLLLREAAAVIERLPVTADGVPVTPGMTVWTWFADELEPVDITCVRPSGTYKACYSTEQAAKSKETP